MPGELELQQKPKHNLISGDFVIILAVMLGVLLSGSFFARTSFYPDRGLYETEIIEQPVTEAKNGLQLNTFDVQRCTNNTAVDFLIDNSGSMQFGTKMEELKQALNVFAEKFPPTGAIALQTYSETVKDRVSFELFRDAKNKFISEVDSMQKESATHSKDAFIVAQKSLEQGKLKFPDHKFALVFISDGIPETKKANDACVDPQFVNNTCMEHPLVPGECRCYDADQDPREIAAQIKATGTRIFTIAFTDTLAGGADAPLDAKLQLLMSDVASNPTDYYLAPIDSELTGVIDQISNRICTLL